MSIYYSITEWQPFRCSNCIEYFAVCPECAGSVCVFCDDYCESCDAKVF